MAKAKNKKITTDDFDSMMDNLENDNETIKDTTYRADEQNQHIWSNKLDARQRLKTKKDNYFDLHIKISNEQGVMLRYVANKLNNLDDTNTNMKLCKDVTLTDIIEDLIDKYAYTLIDIDNK